MREDCAVCSKKLPVNLKTNNSMAIDVEKKVEIARVL